MHRARAALVALVTLALLATACGDDGDGGGGTVSVVASFYPVAFAAERVGGPEVEVEDLTPAGAEAHDLELTSDQVDGLLDADVALVLGKGFQPAVERSAGQRDGVAVELLPRLIDTEDEQVAEEGESGGLDPHVWLDPSLMADLAAEVAAALIEADPEHQARYERNLEALQDELAALDAQFEARLGACTRDLLVTSHEAFGYLAQKYGLQQEGVAGLSPDAEPDAQRLAELADLAREEGVTTVFTEEAVSPRIAETLAREAGGLRTDVLSPLETLSEREREADDDYFSIMDSNLEKIAAALDC